MAAAQLRDEVMRQTGWFGNAHPARAFEEKADGGGQVDAMANRDKDRARFGLRADHRADDISLWVAQFSPRPLRLVRFLIAAVQERFCAANRWLVKHQAHMGSNPHAARMGESLAIEDDHIGLGRQLLKDFDERGP